MIVQCPICSSENINHVDDSLSIFKCKDCTHEFSLTSKDRQEKYGGDYYDIKSKNWFSHPNYRLFNSIISQLPENAKNLLDIGCGNGDFLKYLRGKNNKIKLTGIDLLKNQYDGVTFIQGDIYTSELNEKYDVITSLGVIEHLEDVKRFIGIIKELLNNSGIAIIMTIDSESLIYRISKSIKKYIRTPYNQLYEYKHLHHFTRKSLLNLFERADFEVIKQITHNYPLRAIDIHNGNLLTSNFHKISAIGIFLLSSLIKKEMLQTIICKKR